MAYYCGECIVWRGSSDENRYGERWCSYSRRYERSDQNTYGCDGFRYVGRAVLTKVCEILKLHANPWFDAFDQVKEDYLVPGHMGMLENYCGIGPVLAEKLDQDPQRETVAKQLLDAYLSPARKLEQEKRYCQAVELYRSMVKVLSERYLVSNC